MYKLLFLNVSSKYAFYFPTRVGKWSMASASARRIEQDYRLSSGFRSPQRWLFKLLSWFSQLRTLHFQSTLVYVSRIGGHISNCHLVWSSVWFFFCLYLFFTYLTQRKIIHSHTHTYLSHTHAYIYTHIPTHIQTNILFLS